MPGLRREEVADAARVSLDYYARLEQGRQVTASPSVLDALAHALRLSEEERAHLYTLAGVAHADTPETDGAETAGTVGFDWSWTPSGVRPLSRAALTSTCSPQMRQRSSSSPTSTPCHRVKETPCAGC